MPIGIERIDVGAARVEARVRVSAPAPLRTRAVPGLPQAAVALLPGLARHSCENDAGRDMVRELADTETPHLLEHVASELMALAGSPRTLKGETTWDFARDGHGVFRVRLAYDDDLVAVGALTEALAVVEWLIAMDVSSAGPPDIDSVVQRLRGLRAL